ncbi:hypothetical protein [Psychrobacter piscatorii]|uniref:hypothetical protein n=1 Tax=Psychrobacter piscatorii TaxID=554343 RepID=UPI00191AAAC6|nr:hypothetical protein [Psychrobacter piscatorii]
MGEVIIDSKNNVNFQNNMAHNLAIAKRDNFDYKHIVFPAKPIIYKEHFKSIGINLNSIFSQSFHHPDVIYPNLSIEDYHLQDTQINDAGSFKVISKVLENLGYPALPNLIFTDDKKLGDLTIMLGKDDFENIKVVSGFTDMLFEPREFTFGAALKGNTGDIKILVNPKALYKRRLVLFGDSFFEFSLRVYSGLFNEVIYLRKPYIIDDIMRILEPAVVLTANTERYLYSVPDCNKDKPWFMNYLSRKFKSDLLSDESRNAFEAMFSGKKSKVYKETFGDILE